MGKNAKKFGKGVYKEGGSVENTASVLGRARCAPQALDRGGRNRRLTEEAGRPRMSWHPRKGERFFGILSEGEERERVEAREPLSIRNERQKKPDSLASGRKDF